MVSSRRSPIFVPRTRPGRDVNQRSLFMSDGIGDYICMAGAVVFVAFVVNAKAQRAGGWANYGLGCLMMFAGIFILGFALKACRAIF